jgi:hypothetical protein
MCIVSAKYAAWKKSVARIVKHCEKCHIKNSGKILSDWFNTGQKENSQMFCFN